MASLVPTDKRLSLLLMGITLILPHSTTVHGASSGNFSLALPNCAEKCGNLSIPYPFGIGKDSLGKDCFLRKDFEVICNTTSQQAPTIYTGGTPDEYSKVLDISLLDGEVRIQNRIHWSCNYTNGTYITSNESPALSLGLGNSLKVSYTKNKVTAIGCVAIAHIVGSTDEVVDFRNWHYTTACASYCDSTSRISRGPDCDGMGCCQTSLPQYLSAFYFKFFHYDDFRSYPEAQGFSPCSYAFVVEASKFSFKPSYAENLNFQKQDGLPMVLDWRVGTENCVEAKKNLSYACVAMNSECVNVTNGIGYRCNCSQGYQGNPYLPEGCQDINECDFPETYNCRGDCINTKGAYICACPEGTHSIDPNNVPCVPGSKVHIGLSIGIGVGSATTCVLLVLVAIFIIKKMKHRRAIKVKKKFFEQNRGQLLLQLVSQRADIAERMIIAVDEIEKATNNFDKTRELGAGGHGMVYKGILLDLRVVAIKKSKIAVQKEIDEFINEVAILSQINHRNVVKLLGCCLETEVPLLVYEFISNGTLYHHLHVETPRSLSWSNRLRIASETANALAYLHSLVSIPIIHRDIKSSNILLDDALTAKISDFGASRYIPLNKTGLTTIVQGTIGYLDPMYFYEGRITNKSDVYSFGVILVELLTRKKPFSYLFSDSDGLVAHFVNLHGEGNLSQILDPQVMEEGLGEEVQEVASLAVSCVRLRCQDRPTMRQVDIILEGLLSSKNHVGDNTLAMELEEDSRVVLDYLSPYEGTSTSTSISTSTRTSTGSLTNGMVHMKIP